MAGTNTALSPTAKLRGATTVNVKTLIVAFLGLFSIFAIFLIVQGNTHITDSFSGLHLPDNLVATSNTVLRNKEAVPTSSNLKGYKGYVKHETRLKAVDVFPVPNGPSLEDKQNEILRDHDYSKIQNPNGKHRLHIVFSSGCTEFQQWQSLVLLHSAQKIVPQPSRITRIVSGCDEPHKVSKHSDNDTPTVRNGGQSSKAKLTSREYIEQTTNPLASFHYTPAFGGANAFPWMNKPFGLSHWLATKRNEIQEEVIAILDPDFVFLGPSFSQEPDYLAHSERGETICTHGCPSVPFTDEVFPGHPVAQRYGLNTRMADPGVFDRDAICGQESPCATVGRGDSMRFFSIGPPYIMSTTDADKLLPLWKELMPAVYERDKKDIIADMWAFSMAAAHLKLPFLTLDHYMVSVPGKEGSNKGEAWNWINEFEHMSCHNPIPPKNKLDGTPYTFRLPTFIHMSQAYKVDGWYFHKGHVPPAIFSCDAPLLRVPPDNIFDTQQDIRTRHNAFLLCSVVYQINDAALAWKEKFCTKPYESRKMYRLHGSRVKSCPESGEPKFGVSSKVPCWEYASLEEPDETN